MAEERRSTRRWSRPGSCRRWAWGDGTPTNARDEAGNRLNVNADTAAGAVAAAMKAEKLIVVSDTHGIRRDVNDPDSRVSHLDVSQIQEMVTSRAIGTGMLPKVEACVQAL